MGIDIISIVAAITSILAIIKTLITIKNSSNADVYLYNFITKKLPKMQFIVKGARIAEVSLMFADFVKEDLADGNLDSLAIFENFLKAIKKNKVAVKMYLETAN